jgi:hypothetical protein
LLGETYGATTSRKASDRACVVRAKVGARRSQ